MNSYYAHHSVVPPPLCCTTEGASATVTYADPNPELAYFAVVRSAAPGTFRYANVFVRLLGCSCTANATQ